ncbi:MAG: FAD-binding oxidoreductase, partial [Bryobacterales bacterium]|nr:FAD-binding oxidoreductase [Bryobacterales bacterium]
CADYARDWGRFTRQVPRGVVSPRSAEEVAGVVRSASREGVQLAIRGGGHSQGGQTLTERGVVLSTELLNRIELADSDLLRMQGGAEFGHAVNCMHGSGRLPAVLPDYATITAGGLISAGGVGSTSHRHGLFVQQVERLEVVTGTGERVRCSMDRNAGLFHAVRSGQGQFGVITDAWIRTRKLRSRCRMYELHYRDPERFVADIGRVMDDGRFDHLKGEIRINEGLIILSAGLDYDYDKEPGDTKLLGGLGHDEHVSTRDIVGHGSNQMYPRWVFSRQHIHPWQDWFLPFEALGKLLDPHWLDWRRLTDRPLRWVGLYFLGGDAYQQRPPLLMVPPGERAVCFSILNMADTNRDAKAMAVLRYLEQVDRDVIRLGGKRYLSGACRFDRKRWKQHYGRVMDMGIDWKQAFDPGSVFSGAHMPFSADANGHRRDSETKHAGSS